MAKVQIDHQLIDLAHTDGLSLADRIGRVGQPAQPASSERCEGCGCGLSKYRVEGETGCWACLHPEVPVSERERRLVLLAAGRLPPITPQAQFICPECRGVKSAGAARCARCRFTAPHPKKPPLSRSLKAGPCPVCGGAKNPKARLCRTCWALDQRLLFAGNPAITCPDCGGPRVRKAERCRKCSDRFKYGTVYVGDRPLSLICPDCGGPKKLKRALRCRSCAFRFRREQAAGPVGGPCAPTLARSDG